MKVRLEKATRELVQTFAWGAVEHAEHVVAVQLGFVDAEGMFTELLEGSREAYALLTDLGPVPIAMMGVLKQGTGLLWMHMAPAFKAAGFGALRVARLLINRLVMDHGELRVDVEASNPDLVRMADWLGFKLCGPNVEKLGRTFHQCKLRRAA